MSGIDERRYRDLLARIVNLESAGRPRWLSGEWTPTFTGSTTAGTFTYSSQIGYWRRVNDIILAWGDVAISAISVAPVGDMRITGLPVDVVSVIAPASIVVSQLDYPAGAQEITAQAISTAAYLALGYTQDNGATTNYPAASFTNTSTRVRLFVAYLA